jgi:carboxymethylenebutenolidase
VLGLFSAEEHAVPVSVPTAFEKALTEAGIDHEIVVYPGRPHGFFEPDRYGDEGHAEAAADAYRRLTDFRRIPSSIAMC